MHAEPLSVVVAEIWRNVLAVDTVGPDDDFIDLGGDSIAAVQIVEQVRRRLGVRLAVDAVLDKPTVSQFAALIDEQLQGNDV